MRREEKNLSPVLLSVFSFCLTVRAYLNTQKYGHVLQSRAAGDEQGLIGLEAFPGYTPIDFNSWMPPWVLNPIWGMRIMKTG